MNPLILICIFSTISLFTPEELYKIISSYKEEDLRVVPASEKNINGFELICEAIQVSSPPKELSPKELRELSKKNSDIVLKQIVLSNKIVIIHIPIRGDENLLNEFRAKGKEQSSALKRIKEELSRLNNLEGPPFKVKIFGKIKIPDVYEERGADENFHIQIYAGMRKLKPSTINRFEESTGLKLLNSREYHRDGYFYKYYTKRAFSSKIESQKEIERLYSLGYIDGFIVTKLKKYVFSKER
jgi:hypothetical protein